MPLRYDRYSIDAAERTPQGGLRVPAAVGRTGILVYRLPDGSERREYRPPEEAFAEASLATLPDAPVTVDHPPVGRVSADSYRRYSVGHVASTLPQRDGDKLVTTIAIQDAATVEKVLAKELKEISCGYDSDLDFSPGTGPDGEEYDAIQRNIRYNHVALLPVGKGRAGSEVALRLDARDNQTRNDEMDPEEIKSMIATVLAPFAERIQAIEAKMNAAPAADAQPAPAAPAPAPVVEEEKTDAFEQAVARKTRLVLDAARILGKDAPNDLASKSEREIMLSVIKRDMKDLQITDDATVDYLRGLFQGCAARTVGTVAADPYAPLSVVRADSAAAPQKTARERMIERNNSAWKNPGAVAKS